MFKSAYETTSGGAAFRQSLTKQLALARAEGTIQNNVVDGVGDLYALLDTGPRTADIPTFDHPFQVDEQGCAAYWVIDLRPYKGKVMANQGKIPRSGPVNLLVKRALTDMYWNQYGSYNLRMVGDLPIVVYARWLSGLLTTRLHLDPAASSRSLLLAAYFYLCQHVEPADLDAKLSQAFALKLNKLFRTPLQDIEALLDGVPHIGTLSQFADVLKARGQSKSFALVDNRFLVTVSVMSWFGSADSRAMLACALEYPPIFMAIVAASGEDLYRKTVLAEIVKRENRNYRVADYAQRLDATLRELKS